MSPARLEEHHRYQACGLTATGTGHVATLALRKLLGSDRGSDSNRQVVEAQVVEHLLRVGVDFDRVDRRVQSRHLGHVLVL